MNYLVYTTGVIGIAIMAFMIGHRKGQFDILKKVALIISIAKEGRYVEEIDTSDPFTALDDVDESESYNVIRRMVFLDRTYIDNIAYRHPSRWYM